MMIALILLAATIRLAPPGLDADHIPLGSPLGAMPIVVSPGESPALLRKPMSEAEWWRQRRAAIARSMKNPRMRAIAQAVDEIDRAEARREAAERAAKPSGKP